MSFATRGFEIIKAHQINPATLPAEYHELRARLAALGCEVVAAPDTPGPIAYVLHWCRGPLRTRRCYAAVSTLAALREHAQRLERGDR